MAKVVWDTPCILKISLQSRVTKGGTLGNHGRLFVPRYYLQEKIFVSYEEYGVTLIFCMKLLVGSKYGCIPETSFLGAMEVVYKFLWLGG